MTGSYSILLNRTPSDVCEFHASQGRASAIMTMSAVATRPFGQVRTRVHIVYINVSDSRHKGLVNLKATVRFGILGRQFWRNHCLLQREGGTV